MIKKEVALFYKDAGSDKVYNLNIQEVQGLFTVNFEYGKRGSKLKDGTKTVTPVSLQEAENIYDSLLKEKTAKGYSSKQGVGAFQSVELKDRVTGIVPQLLNNIYESMWKRVIEDDNWVIQEKFDGRRLLIKYTGGVAVGINKKGLSVEVLDEVYSIIKKVKFDLELDGELMADGKYHIFDILHINGKSTKEMGVLERYNILSCIEELKDNIAPIYLSTDEKRKAVERLKEDKKEGFVAKLKDSPYVPGRPASGGNQLKGKFWESATLKVMEITKTKRSVTVGAFKDGVLTDVGNVKIPTNYDVPKVGEYVEVIYLYCTPGNNGKIYQSKYKGIRDDQNDEDCDFSKLKVKASSDDEDDSEMEIEMDLEKEKDVLSDSDKKKESVSKRMKKII